MALLLSTSSSSSSYQSVTLFYVFVLVFWKVVDQSQLLETECAPESNEDGTDKCKETHLAVPGGEMRLSTSNLHKVERKEKIIVIR